MGIIRIFSPQHRANDTADIAANVDSINKSAKGIHALAAAYEAKAYIGGLQLNELRGMGLASGTLGAQLHQAIKNNIELSKALTATADTALDVKRDALLAQQDQLKPKNQREIKRSGSDLRKQSEALAINLRLALLKCKNEVSELETEQAEFDKPMNTVLGKFTEPLHRVFELDQELDRLMNIGSTDYSLSKYREVETQRTQAQAALDQVQIEVKETLKTLPTTDKSARYHSYSSMYQSHKVREARNQVMMLSHAETVKRMKADLDKKTNFTTQLLPQAKQMLPLLETLGYSHLKPLLEGFIANQEPVIDSLTDQRSTGTTFKNAASNLNLQETQLSRLSKDYIREQSSKLYDGKSKQGSVNSNEHPALSQQLFASANNSYAKANHAFLSVAKALPSDLFFALRPCLKAQMLYDRASAHLETIENTLFDSNDYLAPFEQAKDSVVKAEKALILAQVSAREALSKLAN